jgi:hypothetical protein
MGCPPPDYKQLLIPQDDHGVLYQNIRRRAIMMNEKYQEWKRQLTKNTGGDHCGGTCSVGVMSLEEGNNSSDVPRSVSC